MKQAKKKTYKKNQLSSTRKLITNSIKEFFEKINKIKISIYNNTEDFLNSLNTPEKVTIKHENKT